MVDSLVVVVVEALEAVLAKPRTLSIEYTSLLRISTKAKRQNWPSRGTYSAQSARAKAERKAPQRLATVAAVVVSKSLCVRWVQ